MIRPYRCFSICLDNEPHHMKSALQVRVQYLVKVFLRHTHQQSVPRDSRIIDQNIDASPCL